MKGPAPKPTALKRLSGTLRKSRQNHDEPQPQAGVPDPPADLDDRARDAWAYYAPLLASCRVLTLADRESLACYCSAAGRRAQAEEELRKHGPIVKSPSGYPIMNPWLCVLNKALEQLLRFGAVLGLDPASRTRIKTTAPVAETNTKARFFKTVG